MVNDFAVMVAKKAVNSFVRTPYESIKAVSYTHLVTAGQTMYLQADTDKYIVWADGYWFS